MSLRILTWQERRTLSDSVAHALQAMSSSAIRNAVHAPPCFPRVEFIRDLNTRHERPLSNQLGKAYFDLPGQKSTTAYLNDMQICLTKLVRGEVDGMLSPFPHSRFFPARVDSTADGTLDTATASLCAVRCSPT